MRDKFTFLNYGLMHIFRVLLIVLLLPAFGQGQNFIGKSKKQVWKFLQKQVKRNDSLDIRMKDTGSQILFSIQPGKTQPGEFVYDFDGKNRCRSEKVTASCDSCFQKFLGQVLRQQRFGWEKINENQYISNFTSRRLIEISPEKNEYWYIILRSNWTRIQYELLRKK